jgi:hypothetical protein
MKKNLKDFIKKITGDSNGTLQGGFGSIRGGIESILSTNVDSCTNKSRCTGTNSNVCVNEFVCEDTTNGSTNCTNKFVCLAA